MRTVKELIAELQKFPEDAQCYAYEGEAFGLNITDANDSDNNGFIHCGPYTNDEPETKLLD